MSLSVGPAAEAEKPVIDGLMQFYLYDFSEMTPPSRQRFDVGANGLFAPYPHLDSYWSEDGRWPLLIRMDGAAIGFALVNQVSNRTGGFVERNMAEFFVMRQHRRGGLATQAVAQVLKLHPGRWEVAVVERNAPAKAFWPSAVAAAGVSDLTRHEGDGERWTGPVWAFTC